MLFKQWVLGGIDILE